MRSTALSLAIAIILTVAGCGTSYQFRYAASVAGRHLADEADHYVSRDATLDDAARAGRQAQIGALRSAAATTQATTTQGIYDAVSPIEAWLRPYITGDARLSAGSKTNHVGRIDKLDALIAAESHRPLAPSTRPTGQ